MTAELILLDVPRGTMSLNTWQRLHWAARMRENKVWILEIQAAAATYLAKRNKPHFECVDIFIERSCISPIKDHDNIYGGLKPVFDALVKTGLIKDDTREVISSLSVIQILVGKKKEVRTVIKIKPLEI